MLKMMNKCMKYYEPSAMESFHRPVILKCGYVMEQRELESILSNFKGDYVLQTANLGYFRKIRQNGKSTYLLTDFSGKLLQECSSLRQSGWLLPGSQPVKEAA